VKIVFMGTPDFSVPVLQQIIEDGYNITAVVTQPDKPVGRKKRITPTPVKVKAEEYGIPVLQPKRLKDQYQDILNLSPDIIVTAAYGQILPKELLQQPQYGCINVHASLLPEYRGGAPIHHAIMDGKKETGITIMYMAEKMDAGDIITQAVIPIAEEDHVGSLFTKLSMTGAKLLSETIPELLNGRINSVPQDHDKATYAYNITREQEKIDWSMSEEEIYNQIRGLHPWPVAYTTYKGLNMKIWWGEKTKLYSSRAPGTIVDIQDNGFVVSTGSDAGILVTDLQLSGKKRMNAVQFLAGASINIGEKLGE
jgi:methionyl-tRNA formyltransferase